MNFTLKNLYLLADFEILLFVIVYFSNLKKFDGKKTRRLNLIELSQIAGRAGRFKNDGT